jgi:hypothetical protein
MYTITEGQDTQLHPYQPTAFHDWLLFDLWGKMQSTGDLQKTMLAGSQSPLEFMKVLARPDTLLAYDQQGPWLAAWCEPVMCGVSLGFWVRDDKRASRTGLKLTHELFSHLFTRYPTVVVITKDEKISRVHEHFGFVYACGLPYLYDGEMAHIAYLTKERYQERYGQPVSHDEVHAALNNPLLGILARITGGVL